MGVEITGAKLLAPFFGNSLYVWATVISITMLGLAIGYFIGAYLIKAKQNTIKILKYVVFTNALWLLFLPFLLNRIYLYLMYHPINFYVSLFFVAGLALFISVSILGLVSPVIIQLLNKQQESAGIYAGRIFALSTFTGILATLLFAFWFIPYFGLRISCFILSILHLIIFILLLQNKKEWFFTLIWLLIATVFILKINPKSPYVLYQKEGIDGQITVYEYETECFGTLRELTVNQITQSVWTESGDYVLDYVNLIYNLTDTFKVNKNENALILGMGGGTLANLLANKNYHVDAIEFDNRIIEAAKKYLHLNKSINVYNDDARHFINTLANSKKKYSIVIFDIFKGEVSPGYVLTAESLSILKKSLHPNAKVIINTHGYLDNKAGLGNLALIHTLKATGFYVSVHSTGNLPEYRNLEIFATLNKKLNIPSTLKYTDSAIILSDNKQQLEHLNAIANLNWRKGYMIQLIKEHQKINPTIFL
jgi:predicted membrane-bound spermidine synthase